jgi:hypothetical protein
MFLFRRNEDFVKVEKPNGDTEQLSNEQFQKRYDPGQRVSDIVEYRRPVGRFAQSPDAFVASLKAATSLCCGAVSEDYYGAWVCSSCKGPWQAS